MGENFLNIVTSFKFPGSYEVLELKVTARAVIKPKFKDLRN